MFNSVAYAANGGGAQNPIAAFLPLIAIFVIFYFLMIRPQQKKQKQHVQMLDSIKAGDEVITGGGICGTVDRIADQTHLIIEIADGVKVQVLRSSIAQVVKKETTAE
mgnify:CR=1 FL=1